MLGLWIGQGLVEGGSPARRHTRAREHTGPDCPKTIARSSSEVVRAGPWAYSCNQGRHSHEYDEGPARLISPHFAPISGWTVARIGPGGRRRRRRRCHRRKPVLAVRRDGYSGNDTATRSGCVLQAAAPRRRCELTTCGAWLGATFWFMGLQQHLERHARYRYNSTIPLPLPRKNKPSPQESTPSYPAAAPC